MKKSTTLSLKSATINVDDMTITEINKDEAKEYSLMDILREWNGIDNISVTFSHDIKA